MTGSIVEVMTIGVSVAVVVRATEEVKSIEASEVGVAGELLSVVVDEPSSEAACMLLVSCSVSFKAVAVTGMSTWMGEWCLPRDRQTRRARQRVCWIPRLAWVLEEEV